MTGIYFSGTGNTKFCVDKFLKEYDYSKNSFSIEDNEALEKIKNDNEIVIGHPVKCILTKLLHKRIISLYSSITRMCTEDCRAELKTALPVSVRN